MKSSLLCTRPGPGRGILQSAKAVMAAARVFRLYSESTALASWPRPGTQTPPQNRRSCLFLNNTKGGFYAEYVSVPAEKVSHLPKTVDLKQAGAIATTRLTALQGIPDALHVREGETVVVHGATGGVGALAVQFAKLRGARVLGTTHHRDGLALLRRIGVDAAIEGRPEIIAEIFGRLAPERIDAVLALLGGEALERCIDASRTEE
jgi:NADPH:quinone reductase-like Zn-dependent oxidoreductase